MIVAGYTTVTLLLCQSNSSQQVLFYHFKAVALSFFQVEML